MRKRESALSANAGVAEAPTRKLASEKQRNYIRTLVDQIDWSDLDEALRVTTLDASKREDLGLAAASDIIDTLKALRKDHSERFPSRAKREAQRHESGRTSDLYVPAGMYRRDDGTIIRVYFGQQSGIMLAKKLVEVEPPAFNMQRGFDHDPGLTHKWEYLGAAYKFVRSDNVSKLSIEEAAEFGRMTGTCAVCARRLDVPESVERGIGPVCFSRMENDDWLTDKQRERLGI